MRQGPCWHTQSAKAVGGEQAVHTPDAAPQPFRPGRPEWYSCQQLDVHPHAHHSAFWNQQQQLIGSRPEAGSSFQPPGLLASEHRTSGDRLPFAGAAHDDGTSDHPIPTIAAPGSWSFGQDTFASGNPLRASVDGQSFGGVPVYGHLGAAHLVSAQQPTPISLGSGISHQGISGGRASFGSAHEGLNAFCPKPITAAPGLGSYHGAFSGGSQQALLPACRDEALRHSWGQSLGHQPNGTALYGFQDPPSLHPMISPPQQFRQEGPAGMPLSSQADPRPDLAALDLMQIDPASMQRHSVRNDATPSFPNPHMRPAHCSTAVGRTGSETQDRRRSSIGADVPWAIREFCRTLHDYYNQYRKLEPISRGLPFPISGCCIFVKQPAASPPSRDCRRNSQGACSAEHVTSTATTGLKRLICVGEVRGCRTGTYPEFKRTFLVVDEGSMQDQLPNPKRLELYLTNRKRSLPELHASISMQAWTADLDDEPCF